jgi:hypothetical protein
MAWMQRMKLRARMLLDRGRAGDRLTAELDYYIEAQKAEAGRLPALFRSRLNGGRG